MKALVVAVGLIALLTAAATGLMSPEQQQVMRQLAQMSWSMAEKS